jgi:hypothetical protein
VHQTENRDQTAPGVPLEEPKMRIAPDTKLSYMGGFLRETEFLTYPGGLVLSVCLLCAAGCGGEARSPDRQDQRQKVTLEEGQAVFKPGGAEGRGQQAVALDDSQWTIVLAAFRGEGHRTTADASLPAIQAVKGLEGAFATTRGQASFIGVGRFTDPALPAAQGQLQQVREMVVSGQKPFGNAFFAPPLTGSIAGSRPEYNLQRARQRLGKGQWVTLQVGVYERMDVKNPSEEDLATIRAAAEEAAVQLRREGEQAFYFHGPRRSMVTVGILPEDDVIKKPDRPISVQAEALRKRHPYNLLNGAGYKTNSSERVTSSAFVRVP